MNSQTRRRSSANLVLAALYITMALCGAAALAEDPKRSSIFSDDGANPKSDNVATPEQNNSASEPVPEPQKRLPIPERSAMDEAEKVIKDVFKNEYARNDTESRRQLAKKLLEQGIATDKRWEEFVLFRELRNIAAAAGDVETTSRAIEETVKAYDVDESEMRAAALQTLLSAVTTPAANVAVARAALDVAGRAVEDDRYELALKVLPVAESAAGKAKDAALLSRSKSMMAEIKDLQKKYATVQTAAEKLKHDPNDASANLTMGQFLCFQKGDWSSGLPMLAKGSDASLRSMAALDISIPTDPRETVKLADFWWRLADKQDSGAKAHLKARAGMWYGTVITELQGMERTGVEKRLAELPHAQVNSNDDNDTSPQTDPLGRPDKQQFLSRMKADNVLARRTPEGIRLSGEGRLVTPEEYKIPLRIDAIAKTDSTNIRLYYAECQVILNWEANQNELRFHGPDNRIKALPGKGKISANEWHRITWVIELDKTTISVDGHPCAAIFARFAGLSGTVGIGPAAGSIVDVKEFLVQVPKE